MKRTLKSLLQRAVSRKKRSPTETALPDPETHPEPKILLGQQGTQERENEHQPTTSQHLDRSSFTHSKEASHYGSSSHASRRPSEQHSISLNEGHAVDATDYARFSGGVPEDTEGSIDDHQASLLAISPGSVPSAATDFFSLGGDSRLRTGNSEMRHNEDIADRNIDQYGSKNSRHSSLTSQKQVSQTAQDQNARRKSVAASIESLRTPESATGSASSLSPKYSLGTGLATEGGLIDGILPHVEGPNALPYNRRDWPHRLARDESLLNSRRRNRRGSVDPNAPVTRRESFGRRNEPSTIPKADGPMCLREAMMIGPEGNNDDHRVNTDGAGDMRNTEDIEIDTRWAPGITHEIVKPTEHEIVEERIHREIHNHEVYHYIQPVVETTILPARHWIYDSNNELVEVAADALPERTGPNQKWSIVGGDEQRSAKYCVTSPPQPRHPRILADKTHITPEGFERKETTILHPPELEDLSTYRGPVLPMEFCHHAEHAAERGSKEVRI